MKNYRPFTSLLNSWNGKEIYNREYRELMKQIKLLLVLQSGLGQSSQGYEEDWKHINDMRNEVQKLGISIKTALGIL